MISLQLGCMRALLLPLILVSPTLLATEVNDRQVAIPVRLGNPIAPDAPPREYKVIVTSDEDGTPTGYRMPLQMHVCADDQCRIVDVTMYWNALGYYERLECPPDAPLTRKEHDLFTDADYRKLDRILKNRQSILGTLPYEALVVKQPEPAEAVDGWSGATPQAVADAVVEGAAFTTWALWRWANGEIVPHLHAATCKQAAPAYTRRLLRSEELREVDFALRYLLTQSPTNTEFIEDAFHVLAKAREIEHVSLALDYVCRVASDQRQLHERLISLVRQMDGYTSRPILDYFTTQPELSIETLEALSAALKDMPYFAVHRILEMLAKEERSAKVEANIVHLLDHDNFFIARRAYKHLLKQTLDGGTRQKLTAFRKQYGNRL